MRACVKIKGRGDGRTEEVGLQAREFTTRIVDLLSILGKNKME